MSYSGQFAIAGVHEYESRWAPDKTSFEIMGESTREALDDAGLALADIDGLFGASMTMGAKRGYGGSPITDIVHIGIGGSVCGPQLVFDVLRGTASQPGCHFVANLDEHDLGEVLRRLSPNTTLFIIVSKSFTTPETMLNAERARSWFLERGGDPQTLGGHFMAVTGNARRAYDFGIDEQNVFPIWEWVGGRFSLWSAAGILTLAIALGWSRFLPSRQRNNGAIGCRVFIRVCGSTSLQEPIRNAEAARCGIQQLAPSRAKQSQRNENTTHSPSRTQGLRRQGRNRRRTNSSADVNR